jgi:hypothetical protein
LPRELGALRHKELEPVPGIGLLVCRAHRRRVPRPSPSSQIHEPMPGTCPPRTNARPCPLRSTNQCPAPAHRHQPTQHQPTAPAHCPARRGRPRGTSPT